MSSPCPEQPLLPGGQDLAMILWVQLEESYRNGSAHQQPRASLDKLMLTLLPLAFPDPEERAARESSLSRCKAKTKESARKGLLYSSMNGGWFTPDYVFILRKVDQPRKWVWMIHSWHHLVADPWLKKNLLHEKYFPTLEAAAARLKDALELDPYPIPK